MKIMLKVVSLVATFVMFCGCESHSTVSQSDDISSDISIQVTSQENNISIPQLNKNNQKICYKKSGRLTTSNSNNTVIVICDAINDTSVETVVSMVVEVEGDYLIYELGNWDYMVLQNGSLIVMDIDSDNIDEIVLFMEVTGNGGTIANIFEISNNAIVLLYDLNEYDLNLETKYADGYNMILNHKRSSFSCEIDISREFGLDFFDENGKLLSNTEIFTLPINSLKIESQNNDSVPMIVCCYDIKLINLLGSVEVSYQYNTNSNLLEIKNIKFIE